MRRVTPPTRSRRIPVTPCALEFMDANAINMVRNHAPASLPADAGALLMIEVDGIESQLDELVSRIVEAASVDGSLQIQRAKSAQEVSALWETRKDL